MHRGLFVEQNMNNLLAAHLCAYRWHEHELMRCGQVLPLRNVSRETATAGSADS
jgi:hypothetical protein